MTELAEDPRKILEFYADRLAAYAKYGSDEETTHIEEDEDEEEIDIERHYVHEGLALAEDYLREEALPVANLIHELLGKGNQTDQR